MPIIQSAPAWKFPRHVNYDSKTSEQRSAHGYHPAHRRPLDADQIEHLETEYFGWVDAELAAEFGIRLDVEAMIAKDLRELEIYLPPRGALFVAVDGADLVGMVFLAPIRDDTAQIRRMYVRPSHQRQGLGGTLFGSALKAAQTLGYARVLLDSPRSWAGAHAVYQAHGLEIVPDYPESEVPEKPAPVLDLHGF